MKPAMIRSIDAQGRIILPVEIRKTMGISTGDILEIRPAEGGIYLSKYKTTSMGTQKIKKLLHLLYSTTGCSIAVCSCEKILFSKGIFLREGTPISHRLSQIVDAGKETHITDNLPIIDSQRYLVDTVIPLTSPLLFTDACALVLLNNEKSPVTEQEQICAKLIASLINTFE